MTRLMEEKDVNIRHICTFREKKDGELMIEMELEVINPRQMVRILHQIEALVNVKAIRCATATDIPLTPTRPTAYYKPE